LLDSRQITIEAATSASGPDTCWIVATDPQEPHDRDLRGQGGGGEWRSMNFSHG
jgi:hypothetical protein